MDAQGGSSPAPPPVGAMAERWLKAPGETPRHSASGVYLNVAKWLHCVTALVKTGNERREGDSVTSRSCSIA